MRKLRGGRKEHEKAPGVVGHIWLQLRRDSIVAGGGGNGRRPSPMVDLTLQVGRDDGAKQGEASG